MDTERTVLESWQQDLTTASWTQGMKPSMLYRMARHFGSNQDLISFAGGAPDHRLFPKEALASAAAKVMVSDPRALQYGRDLPLLKDQIVDLMNRRGVRCSPDQISITAGGQHAMDVLARLFLDHGSELMVEDIVYTGFLQTVMPFQPRLWPIPFNPSHGLDLDYVQAKLASGAAPAFLYTIPDAHNPAGITLGQEKRLRLVQIARQHRLPVVEDDAYGFLNYDHALSIPLRALDEDFVIYMGTFSKILAPGLRLGWIIAPPSLTAKILSIKQLSMLSVAPLSQHIAATYLAENDFWAHIQRLRLEYGRRRDAMLHGLQTFFPTETSWRRPDGGLFVWVRLPDGLDAEELVYRSVEEVKVAFIPGKAFASDAKNKQFDNYMRLSFAKYAPDQIIEGITRLSHVVKQAIYRHSS